VIDRPKRGFAIPLGRWFRGKLGDFARDLLLSETCKRRGFFDPRYLAALLERQRPDDLGLQLWTLLSFELWCRAFLDPVRSARRAGPAARAGDGRARWAS
jgi:asparagine synthase (glutamine-hydrolysing)